MFALARDSLGRAAKIRSYLDENVLSADGFCCQFFGECKRSHEKNFYEGQLHHIGGHFDLIRDNKPYRVAICGQEYGSRDTQINLDSRSEMIEHSGREKRFFAD